MPFAMTKRTIVAHSNVNTHVLKGAEEHTCISIPHVGVVVLDNVVYQRVAPHVWANVVQGEADDFVDEQEPGTLAILEAVIEGKTPA